MSPMEQRTLGRTGRDVSVVGQGTWQFGGDWGEVAEPDAFGVLDAAVESGVTFFDTADVYGDGRSERLIGRYLKDRPDAGILVATKMGRRADQVPENYVLDNFRTWNDRSRANLGVDTLDLVQLHCPPSSVYSSGAVYDALDTLVAEQRIAAYAVSVETCAEALTALARPGRGERPRSPASTSPPGSPRPPHSPRASPRTDRAALDHPAARGHQRDPRGALGGAGPRRRGGRSPPAAPAEHVGRRAGAVRPADPRRDPRPLVTNGRAARGGRP